MIKNHPADSLSIIFKEKMENNDFNWIFNNILK